MPEPAFRIEPAPSTILIVEDEALVREIAALEFADEGFILLQAADAALALLASDTRIDLLFTDISLRNSIDGWQIATNARVLRPESPVIYTTGYEASVPHLVAGALLIRKPYLPRDVIRSVRTMIGC